MTTAVLKATRPWSMAAIDVRRVAFVTALRLISCTLEEDDLENGDTLNVSKVNGSGTTL
jgi:hypothetical protein